MPNRILREGIIQSEPVNSLSWAAEVFYRRLLSVVDDFGRYYAKPELLRSACYPLQVDKVGNSDLVKWLAECAGAGLVRKYAFENKEYLEVLNFKQQVRAKHSKFPCPSCATHTLCTCASSAHLVGDGGGDEGEGGADKSHGGKKTKIPADFSLTDDLIAYAAKKGITNRKVLEDFTESFVLSCKSKGYKYADFGDTWKNWLRRDIEDGKIQKPQAASGAAYKPFGAST